MEQQMIPRILVVDDVEANRFSLRDIIHQAGYMPVLTENGMQALKVMERMAIDLVILDIAMPDMDGFEVCRRIKENVQTREIPIIFSSALDKPEHIKQGFACGGADYITKPFGTEELMARIRAVLRSHRYSEKNEGSHGGKFKFQDLLIDYDKRQVLVDGKEIDLTQTEYNILTFLSIHAGKVLTYAAIIQAVWGYSDYGSVKKLQVNMKNIRKKMGVTPGEKRYIVNELGVGYRMLAEDEE